MIHLAAKLPVIGAIEAMPAARDALEKAPRDRRLPEELIDALARRFLEARRRGSDCANWLAPARFRSRPISPAWADRNRRLPAVSAWLTPRMRRSAATSPILWKRSKPWGPTWSSSRHCATRGCPTGVDLVMIGCGYPDHHADLLASNVSMIASLREHVCRGRRIYSEGGGTAYLGRRMIIDGRRLPGSGDLAVRRRALARPETTGSRHARPAARLLAGPRRNRRARLQERPLALDPEHRAVRVPRLLSEHSRPREIGFTTTTPSAVCSIFISVPCPRSSTPSSDLTPRRCGVHRRAGTPSTSSRQRVGLRR